MKILIIGSNGQLGWELCRRSSTKKNTISAVDLPEFDITDQFDVYNKIQDELPDIIINSAAYTAVDNAESDEINANKVNHKGPLNLSLACRNLDIPLIHISTDYVFDGTKGAPYTHNDPVSPIGIYGKGKEAGESEIRRNLEKHIIVRTSWLYGVYGNNFVKTMLKLAKEHEVIRVVDDQVGCPTFAGDLAESLLSIAESIAVGKNVSWGTYHYCGSGIVSWYDFACQIFEIAVRYSDLKVKSVIPIATSEYPTAAERPVYSALDCSGIKENFGINQRDWKKSLEEMLHELMNS